MTSKIAGNVNPMSLKFEWEINNFCTGCLNVGDRLESPKFSGLKYERGNLKWYIQLYPKGKTEESKDFLSIYLQVHSYTEIKAAVTFMIFNNESKAVVKQSMTEHVFADENGWGYSNFVSRDFVASSENGILNNDKLRIGCEITYKIANEEVEECEDNVLPKLQAEYEALLTSSSFSDVTLISEGKEVKVHKCILAKSSLVFAVMFNAEMKEKQENIVKIADVKYDVLVEMIRFIYAGKANNIDVLANDLAVAADKYALDGLKNTCEKTMIKSLNVDNVIGSFQLADRLRMVKLKEKVIEFIVKNAREVSNKPECEFLPPDVLFKVFRCLANK